MADSFAVDLKDATAPLVLSIDLGSTGTRGGVFDAHGRPVNKTRVRVDHSFRTNAKGRSEISPDQIVSGVVSVLDGVVSRLAPNSIAGVCVDTFASSLVGVDEGAAVTPCYTYADARSASEIPALRGYIAEGRLQQRTGTRLHTSYLPARLRWLARTQPDTFELVDEWMSIGEYVYLRILGVRGVAVSTAAWSGLLNRTSAEWDTETVVAAGIQTGHLAEIRMPDEPFVTVSKKVAKRWPALASAVWFPAIPDGYANHFGSGLADPNTMMLSASTTGAIRMLVEGIPSSVPGGLWCHRVDRHHCLVGGSLNDVGRVSTWLDQLVPAPPGGHREDWLEGPPLEGSPIALPFLTGERSTGWRGDAQGVLAGLTESTDPAALYRGILEGVAMTYRRIVDQIDLLTPQLGRVIASGGFTTAYPGWLRILASVVGLPVIPLQMKRSTLRGNAVLALEQMAPGVERALPELGAVNEPNPAWAEEYQDRFDRWTEVYEALYGQ
ncbi:MAG TPA: gluconokinase [Actinomycetales bacterium]|nr:gluconokinase [Actinomycetales bacterium]